jgi:hypothetical protein
MRVEPMNLQINAELSRLIDQRTDFFRKSNPTPSEIEEFERAGERIGKLFAELEQKKAA